MGQISPSMISHRNNEFSGQFRAKQFRHISLEFRSNWYTSIISVSLNSSAIFGKNGEFQINSWKFQCFLKIFCWSQRLLCSEREQQLIWILHLSLTTSDVNVIGCNKRTHTCYFDISISLLKYCSTKINNCFECDSYHKRRVKSHFDFFCSLSMIFKL